MINQINNKCPYTGIKVGDKIQIINLVGQSLSTIKPTGVVLNVENNKNGIIEFYQQIKVKLQNGQNLMLFVDGKEIDTFIKINN